MLTQLQVINYLLQTKDLSIIQDNNIDNSFFKDAKNEYDFIMRHVKQYSAVPDATTFLKSFPDFEILEVHEPKEFLVNELYREKNENYLAYTFNKVRELLLAGKTDEAMEVYKHSSQKLSETRKLSAINILKDTSRYNDYVEKCSDFNKYYLSTGFRELDESLGGGIDRLNSYFIISARPGVGKTLIMVKFAAAAVKAGLKVGMYEGEMSVNKIAGRFDTLQSHISNSAITHGNISVSNDYKAYLDNLAATNSGEFYILTRDMVPNDRVTVDVLESFIKKYNLDVLYVDQVSLLDSTLRGAKGFEQVADISKSLKNLQVRSKIPIVVASQQNRTTVDEGKSASTENISMSDRLGQDATEIIFLSKSENILTVDIAKARDGAQKLQLKYAIDFDSGKFDYIQSGDDDEPDYGGVRIVD